jgi:hypothetical protein
MLSGVIDLNLNFLGNCGFLPQVSHYVFRPTGVHATHGASASPHSPPLSTAVSFQISRQDFFVSRPISLHGLCTTDLSRKPARHRNVFTCPSGQALSLGYTRLCLKEYASGCQRSARLAKKMQRKLALLDGKLKTV